MDTKKIVEKSVLFMKQLLGQEEIVDSIRRANERDDADNNELMERQCENLNELVRNIADSGGSKEPLAGASEDLRDALVLRYFRNRNAFVETFPNGIDHISPDPVFIWAALMISPLDDRER
jgi:hypothetical protein